MEWPLHTRHRVYGKVVMIGSLHGEPYRCFEDNHGAIAMIPLDALKKSKELPLKAS